MSKQPSGTPKRTRREAEHLYFAEEALKQVEYDLHTHRGAFRQLPFEWEAVLLDVTHEKARVTLRLDRDVIKFFKAMGPGYQPRINLILRAFMHARLAGLLEGPADISAERDAHWASNPRP